MMSAELWLLIIGAVVAGFVQGLSGFAFGMVAMSFWVWGLEPRVAAVLTVFGALTGQIAAAFTLRRGLRWPIFWPFLAGGLIGVPLGVWLLPHLNALLFKFLFGLLLVLWCPVMLFASGLPRISGGGHSGRIGDALAGAAGGVLGGFGGFTGVVPTLWCTLRGFEKDLQRTIVQNFNLAALSFTMAAYLFSGAVTPDLWPQMAIVAPAMLVPSLIGARIYVGLSEASFRRTVLALLTCSGVAMLAASVPGLFFSA